MIRLSRRVCGMLFIAVTLVVGWLTLAGQSGEPAVAVAAGKKQEAKERKKYIILACDGGGVRGVLTARIIQEIEKELQNDIKISFRNRVDCFAGTSTGGLIALGLASGKKPDEIVDLYKEEKTWQGIFKRYVPTEDMTMAQAKVYNGAKTPLTLAETTLKKQIDPGWAANIDSLLFTQYNSAGVKALLMEQTTLAGKHGHKLKDLEKTVVVTTVLLGKKKPDKTVEAWRPVFLHNFKKSDAKPGTDMDQTAKDAEFAGIVTVLDAALCTSAAPTYFPPHKMKFAGDEQFFADGGLFANNPGVASLSMALRSGIDLQDIYIISVGTGSVPHHMKIPPWKGVDQNLDGKPCGIMAWMFPTTHDDVPKTPLIGALFDAGSAADEIYCKAILGERYLRIQVPVGKEIDLANAGEVPYLMDKARTFIRDDFKDHLDWLRKTLKE